MALVPKTLDSVRNGLFGCGFSCLRQCQAHGTVRSAVSKLFSGCGSKHACCCLVQQQCDVLLGDTTVNLPVVDCGFTLVLLMIQCNNLVCLVQYQGEALLLSNGCDVLLLLQMGMCPAVGLVLGMGLE